MTTTTLELDLVAEATALQLIHEHLGGHPLAPITWREFDDREDLEDQRASDLAMEDLLDGRW